MINAEQEASSSNATLKEDDVLLLPSNQHVYDGQRSLSESVLFWRREHTFLIFSGFFLGTLAMLNILGVSRFIDLSFTVPFTRIEVPMPLAIGILPYPLTFLCTDFISELYGKRRANALVWMGLALNAWVMFMLWLGGVLPGFETPDEPVSAFFEIRKLAFGAVSASMLAYLVAQFVDVYLFHFWKKLTKGKHLWLRNNGSTLLSQLVDTVAVILVTHFYAHALRIDDLAPLWPQLFVYIGAGYSFKVITALFDTIPFYIGTHYLRKYLRLPPPE